MSILLAHELGHFVAGRRAGLDPSLPYFLPAPFFFFGTLGALIVTRRPAPTYAALLSTAAAGPWAGLLVAVPATAWGLGHSVGVDSLPAGAVGWDLGDSLLFAQLCRWFGPTGGELVLHPVALAGWAGLMFTAINLLPCGQLDGGHISAALFGRRQRQLGWGIAGTLAALGLVGLGRRWGTEVWLLMAPLVLWLGRRPAQVADPRPPLSWSQRAWGWASLGLFLATFVPQPLRPVSVVRVLPPPGSSQPSPPSLAPSFSL